MSRAQITAIIGSWFAAGLGALWALIVITSTGWLFAPPFDSKEVVIVLPLPLFALFLAAIVNRKERSHRFVRVSFFWVLPVLVVTIATFAVVLICWLCWPL